GFPPLWTSGGSSWLTRCLARTLVSRFPEKKALGTGPARGREPRNGHVGCQGRTLTSADSDSTLATTLNALQSFLFVAPVLVFSVIAHEIAHGYAALKQGDPT